MPQNGRFVVREIAQDEYRHAMPIALKYAADDLKTFSYEAAAAQPGRAPSVDELNDWFFSQTWLGSDLMYRLADHLGALGDVIIPAAYRPSDPAQQTALRRRSQSGRRRFR